MVLHTKLFLNYYPSLSQEDLLMNIGTIPVILMDAMALANLDDIDSIKTCINKAYTYGDDWLTDYESNFELNEGALLYLPLDDINLQPYVSLTLKGIEFFIYPYGIIAFKHKDVLLVKRLD